MSSEDARAQAGEHHHMGDRLGRALGAGDELRPIRTSCLRASRDAGESPSPSSGRRVLRHLRPFWSGAGVAERGRPPPVGEPSSSTYRVRSYSGC